MGSRGQRGDEVGIGKVASSAARVVGREEEKCDRKAPGRPVAQGALLGQGGPTCWYEVFSLLDS